jgi:hypothetical protein
LQVVRQKPGIGTRILNALLFVVCGLTLVAALLYLFFYVTMAKVENLPALQDGDVVFNISPSSQSLPIMLASRSLLTHMGIVRLDKNGKPEVVEASATVRATPLQDWIDHGIAGRLVIKRPKEITPEQLEGIFSFTARQAGKPYDIFFTEEDDRFYCSELVHDAFRAGAEITLGKAQKIGELALDSGPVLALMQERWQAYPLCRDGQVKNFAACMEIVKQQTLVTPASIAADAQLVPVYSNF